MAKQLVMAGTGHAHLAVMEKIPLFLAEGWQVKAVGEHPLHTYSGMAPGWIAGRYKKEALEISVAKKIQAAGGQFIQDRVTGIDAVNRTLRLASGTHLHWDLLSCNLGSEVTTPFPIADIPHCFARPVAGLMAASVRILRMVAKGKGARVVVAGGGAAAVEIAGNLASVQTGGRRPAVTLVTQGALLAGFPERAVLAVRKNFTDRRIHILEKTKILGADATGLICLEGTIPADYLVMATGAKPVSLLRNSGLFTGPAGGIAVSRALASLGHPDLFAAGDCADFGDPVLQKAGVYAIRQGPVLASNLLAAAKGEGMRVYKPQKKWLQILNLGDGTGVVRRGEWAGYGRWAMQMKHAIDRRFMLSQKV